MVHRIRPHLTAANIMSALALFIALGGTSYAAISITGANVRDNSLTGRDVRNGSLGTADLAATARRALRGQRGLRGATGMAGERGSDGATGATGPAGATGAQGVAGPKGDPGERGEDGIDWQGAWSASTLYAPGDGVTVDGSSYRAIAISMNQQPPSATYWQVIAARGADGAEGQDGDAGPQGEQGLTGPRGPSDLFETAAFSSDAVGDITGAGSSTIDSIDLPAGRYWLSAMVILQGTAASPVVQCQWASTGEPPKSSQSYVKLADDGTDTLPVTGKVALASAATISLMCGKYGPTGAITANTSIDALRVETITSQ